MTLRYCGVAVPRYRPRRVYASDTGRALKPNMVDVFIGDSLMVRHALRLGVQHWNVRVCEVEAPPRGAAVDGIIASADTGLEHRSGGSPRSGQASPPCLRATRVSSLFLRWELFVFRFGSAGRKMPTPVVPPTSRRPRSGCRPL
jgi:hypothetical protein